MLKQKKYEKENRSYDYSLKILTVGCTMVGKTAILIRITENMFFTNNMTTIGVDLKLKDYIIDNKTVQGKFWDTAGQEKFVNITSQYYKNSNGILLVFDVNDRESFNKVSEWMEEIKGKKGRALIILVGNKIDVDKREVTTEEGHVVADKYGIKYYETSAKTGFNITEMVEDFLRQLIKEEDKEKKNNNNNEEFSLHLPQDKTNKKICC